ncbi:MAG: hypothetical protein U0237_08460 [Thermoleophilia bacterium]
MRPPGRGPAAGLALGAALVVAGAAVPATRGVALPARPSGTVRFAGAALVLLAAAPVLWGAAVIGVATGRLRRDASLTHGLVAAGFAAGVAAFLVAQAG